MYQSDISDHAWILCGVPADISWILYLVGLGLRIGGSRSGGALDVLLLCLQVIAAIGVVVGIAELIDERIHKLDRMLPKARLYRGFGALVAAGALGGLCAIPMLALSGATAPNLMMLIGGFLCALFSFLLFSRYKKL